MTAIGNVSSDRAMRDPSRSQDRVNAVVVSLRGRLDRTGFCVRTVVLALALAATWFACFKFPYADVFGPDALLPVVAVGVLCVMVSAVVLVLLSFAITQRLHDMDLPGGWVLVLLVPVANLSGLALFFWPGTPENNRFDVGTADDAQPGPGSHAGAAGAVIGVGLMSGLLAVIAAAVAVVAFAWFCLTHIRV